MKILKQSVQQADKRVIHHADYTFEVQKHSEGQHRTDGEEGRESDTHKDPKIRTGLYFSWPLNKAHTGQRRGHWDTASLRTKGGEGGIKGPGRDFSLNVF